MPDLATVSDDFLGLVSAFSHAFDAGVVSQCFIWNAFEHGVFSQLGHLPVVEVFNIGHSVDPAIRLKAVGIVCQKSCVHNSATVIGLLKVGVSEAEEHLGELQAMSQVNVGLTDSFSK